MLRVDPMSHRGPALTPVEIAWRALGIEFGQLLNAKVSPVAPRRERPSAWSVIVVLDRLEEVYQVLARTRMPTRPRAYGNSMPVYVQERHTLKDQIDMELAGDLAADRRDRLRDRAAPPA